MSEGKEVISIDIVFFFLETMVFLLRDGGLRGSLLINGGTGRLEASAPFDVVFIFLKTTSLSLVKGDWNPALRLLEDVGFGVRGPVFIGAVYRRTNVPFNNKKERFNLVIILCGVMDCAAIERGTTRWLNESG